MESSPVLPGRCGRMVYKTHGSCSGPPASAGMSHVSLHQWYLPWSGIRQPCNLHSLLRTLLSLQTGFCLKPPEVGPHPISGDAPSWGLINTAGRVGWLFFPPWPRQGRLSYCKCMPRVIGPHQGLHAFYIDPSTLSFFRTHDLSVCARSTCELFYPRTLSSPLFTQSLLVLWSEGSTWCVWSLPCVITFIACTSYRQKGLCLSIGTRRGPIALNRSIG